MGGLNVLTERLDQTRKPNRHRSAERTAEEQAVINEANAQHREDPEWHERFCAAVKKGNTNSWARAAMQARGISPYATGKRAKDTKAMQPSPVGTRVLESSERGPRTSPAQYVPTTATAFMATATIGHVSPREGPAAPEPHPEWRSGPSAWRMAQPHELDDEDLA